MPRHILAAVATLALVACGCKTADVNDRPSPPSPPATDGGAPLDSSPPEAPPSSASCSSACVACACGTLRCPSGSVEDSACRCLDESAHAYVTPLSQGPCDDACGGASCAPGDFLDFECACHPP